VGGPTTYQPPVHGRPAPRRLLFTINVFGVLCEFFNNAQAVINIGRGGEVTSMVPDANFAVSKTSGGFLCPSNGFFAANAANSRVTESDGRTIITVRLI
jgi:hypothetical protein